MSAALGANPRVGRLAIAVAVALLILGIAQAGSARVDFLPEFMPPSVQVQTEALGLSAAEVEQLVTVPLEQDLLNGVPWLDRIHSRSEPGLSAIDIVFEPGTDIYAARQMVQERLTQAHALPAVGSPPIMVEPLASVSRVEMIGLTSTDVSLIDMSVLARWKIRPRLMGISGVANVAIYGMRDRQLQVQVDPATLKSRNVSLTQVIETAGNALWVSPLTFVEASTPGTGGFLESSNQRLAVQHVLPITTPRSLGEVPIEGAETPTRLGDVTTIVEDHQPLIGDAVDTKPALFLVVQKYPEADTVEVTRAVEDAMASLKPGLGGIDIETSVFRPATFLDNARQNVGLAAALGLAALLLGALLLFWSWRAAVVVSAAVTVSAVTTLYLLSIRGVTLTTMTLAGLVVALVLVVSMSVGDVDAVRRERAAAGDGEESGSPTAGSELSALVGTALGRTLRTGPVVMLIGALALVPLLVLDPVSAAFTRPLVLTFVLAAVVSVAVELTVVPALLVLLMRRAPSPGPSPAQRLARTLEPRVRRMVTARWPVWTLAVLLVAAGSAAVPQLSQPNFVPVARDLDLLLHVETVQGTSLAEASRVNTLISEDLRSVPGVREVGGHVGRAVTSDQLGDVNASELWISLDAGADYDSTRAGVLRAAARYPGVRTRLVSYSADQLSAARSGSAADVTVRILGPELTALQSTAAQVATSLSGVADVSGAHVVPISQQPTVQVEVDLAAAQKYGLRPGDVRREATTLASGLTVGNLYEQAKVFDVVVLGTPTSRSSVSALGNLLVNTPSGEQVRLGDVAKITVAPQPASIVHDSVQRSVDVVASLTGSNAAAAVEAVEAAVASVPVPPESHVQVVSAAADRQVDLRRVLAVALAILVAIVLILQAATASWRRAVVLTVVAPLGGVGAVLVAPAVGGVGTAGPALATFAAALLTIFGALAYYRTPAVTTARNTVTSRASVAPSLPTNGGDGAPDGTTEADLGTVNGAQIGDLAAEHVLPVVRTALLLVVAALPAILLGDRPGLELLRPFAAGLVGGVVTSTLVVLLLVPAFAGLRKGVER
jgi:Cu/Ag efflux pump CusA